MSVRTVYPESISGEEALILANFIITLPETSKLREALALMLDTLSRGKKIYVFANTVDHQIDPDDGP